MEHTIIGFDGFPKEALPFFRSLKRNNRREWFQPRKHIYDEKVRGPMVELVAALTAEMMDYAPAHVCDPARAVYRVLIEAGVHPDRVGYRAMGEVAPESTGTDEASLALNRRVLFRIERQLASDQPAPEWPPVPVPWTGRLPRASK